MNDLIPYLPNVFEKIASNLECYVKDLESGKTIYEWDWGRPLDDKRASDLLVLSDIGGHVAETESKPRLVRGNAPYFKVELEQEPAGSNPTDLSHKG